MLTFIFFKIKGDSVTQGRVVVKFPVRSVEKTERELRKFVSNLSSESIPTHTLAILHTSKYAASSGSKKSAENVRLCACRMMVDPFKNSGLCTLLLY
jgi:hypothetical protein